MNRDPIYLRLNTEDGSNGVESERQMVSVRIPLTNDRSMRGDGLCKN